MRCRCLMGFSLLLCGSPAIADIYKCVDGQGHVTYTNDKGNARGCTQLSDDLPVSSVPAVKLPPKAPAAGSSGGASAGFPRVSSDDQRSRDDNRRQILTRELEAEQRALDEARKAFDEQDAIRLGDERNYQKKLDRVQPYKDKVELHERNVEALRKEIANLR